MYKHFDKHPIYIDPTIRLIEKFNQSKIPTKINMTIGMYYDEDGKCLLLNSTKEAEKFIYNKEQHKSYLGLAGCEKYRQLIQKKYFENLLKIHHQYCRVIHTAGGSSAIRITLEMIKRINPTARCWIGIPTWTHYETIISVTDLQLITYNYVWEIETNHFILYLEHQFSSLQPNDVVILQGPCHNPTGIDYDFNKWNMLLAFLSSKKVMLIIDIAYMGLANPLTADLKYLDILAQHFENYYVCISFSKIFTLYNERVGALAIISNNKKQVNRLETLGCSIASTLYFMPPHHGAAIVTTILTSDELSIKWQHELSLIRMRLQNTRIYLDEKLKNSHYKFLINFSKKNGLFSILPLSRNDHNKLRKDHGIFILDSGRINISSLNAMNLDYFCNALCQC